MKQKIIAREILIFFSIILLTRLFSLSLYSYNYIIENQIKLKELKIKNYQISLDSLKNKSSALLVDNSIYKFFKTNKLTDLSQADFIKNYLNRNEAETLIAINKNIELINKNLILENTNRSLLVANLLKRNNILNYSLIFLIILSVITYPGTFSFL